MRNVRTDKGKKQILKIMAALLAVMLFFTGCRKGEPDELPAFGNSIGQTQTTEEGKEASRDSSASWGNPYIPPQTETEAIEEPPAFQEYEISLMAIGDNLIHMGVVYAGKQSDGSRNYSFLFDGIRELIEAADVKIINQETILAGNEKGFSGYPKFNSPTEVGDAIAEAGFNVVLHATNHSADMGVEGMESCINFWGTHPEVLLTGIHLPGTAYGHILEEGNADGQEPARGGEKDTGESEAPADAAEETSEAEPDAEGRIPLLTIGDVTFAILNYTYGPNYSTVPKNVTDRLELLCAIDEKTRALDFTSLNPQVLEDIQTAEKLADIVVVCPHWGTENSATPSKYQEKFALQMTEAGADLIIGTHPHVVQPIEWIEAENGNRALCFYSLGNYVSTMQGGRNMLEGMAWVTFRVTETGITLVEEKSGMLPMVCHYTSGPVRVKRVYPLEEYTQELAASHGIIKYGGISFSLDDLTGWKDEVIGKWTLTKEQILGFTTEDADAGASASENSEQSS